VTDQLTDHVTDQLTNHVTDQPTDHVSDQPTDHVTDQLTAKVININLRGREHNCIQSSRLFLLVLQTLVVVINPR